MFIRLGTDFGLQSKNLLPEEFMKSLIKLLLIAFLLAATPLSSMAQDRSTQNLTYFLPKTEFVFQTVVEGIEVVHEFTIINKGSDTLSILDIKTD